MDLIKADDYEPLPGVSNGWRKKGDKTKLLFGRQGQTLADLVAEINTDLTAES